MRLRHLSSAVAALSLLPLACTRKSDDSGGPVTKKMSGEISRLQEEASQSEQRRNELEKELLTLKAKLATPGSLSAEGTPAPGANRELEQKLASLESQLAAMAEKHEETLATIASLEEKHAATASALRDLEEKHTQALARLNDVEAQHAATTKKLSDLETTHAATTKKLSDLEALQSETSKKLADTTASLEKTEQALSSLAGATGSLRDELTKQKEQLEAQKNDLLRQQADLDLQRKDLSHQGELLSAELLVLKQQQVELERQRNELARHTEALTRQQNVLRRQEAELTAQRHELQTQRDELERQQAALARERARVGADIARLERVIASQNAALAETREAIEARIRSVQGQLSALTTRVRDLEHKFLEKLRAGNLARANFQMLTGNREKYGVFNTPTKLEGDYRILVIPIEFQDVKFKIPDVKSQINRDLFDESSASLAAYYRTASGGTFHVNGVVADTITVSGKIADYGAATPDGGHDVATRALGAETLAKVRSQEEALGGFDQFDNWDLDDYDSDKNYHERDGIADAVVFVVAGQDEAQCTGAYSDDARAKACADSIWPHRWTLLLPKDHPLRATHGPLVDGEERAIRGVVLNDRVQAWDYNMQTENSATSTYIHEFGHSLTLHDLYAYDGDNNVGEWDIMASQVEGDTAQNLSSFHKMVLGWLNPKVVDYTHGGEPTSLYLGDTNFYSESQRQDDHPASGLDILPRFLSELLNGQAYYPSIVGKAGSEGVYRAAQVYLPDYVEPLKVVDWNPVGHGRGAAYSGSDDNLNVTYSHSLRVPNTGEATLSFDTLYRVETETNLDDPAVPNEQVGIVQEWDYVLVKVNGVQQAKLTSISGDENGNGLNEHAPGCSEARVFELRTGILSGTATDEEKKEYETLTKTTCRVPTWTHHTLDLREHRGELVKLELNYLTDTSTSDLGLFVDNVRFNRRIEEDFEGPSPELGDFQLCEQGVCQKKYGHFYVVEHRDPVNRGEGVFNHDSLMRDGSQGFFAPATREGETLRDRFRYIRYHAQPGALVWYFQPRSRENEPEQNGGTGMLLPVASAIRDLILPSELGKPELLMTDPVLGIPTYDLTGEAYAAARKAQRGAFVCFGLYDYYRNVLNETPDCSPYAPEDVSALKKLSLDGRSLIYSGEALLDVLPEVRRHQELVWMPFTGVGTAKAKRGSPSLRATLATFRAAGAPAYNPFEIFKVGADGSTLVPDAELTAAAPTYASQSQFSDANYAANAPWRAHERFSLDSAVVVPMGLQMSFSEPDPRVVAAFSEANPESPAARGRAPRIKVSLWRETR